jgi:AcrR family transcriptional regulator
VDQRSNIFRLDRWSISVKMTLVNSPVQRNPRRSDALSRNRIVEASIEILDADGESGLTVRAVTAHLSTGRGAIYHHIAGKEELLSIAAEGVIAHVLADIDPEGDPRAVIRSLALGVFNAIGLHPWVGTQLSRDPFQPAVLSIWTAIGVQLQRLDIQGSDRSDAGAALVNYVVGALAQYAAGAGRASDDVTRAQFLDALATRWSEHDSSSWVQESATVLREHDDREQFLAGVDIFLSGITHRQAGAPDTHE